MLSKFFGSKSKSEDEMSPLADGVRRSILGYLGMKSIPIMPKAAQQAFQLSANPNAEASDYIAIVERDEGLSSRVLKIANSVFYDRGGGSKTIADAVNVIGLTELKGLLNATTLTNLFPTRHPLRAQLWAHNVATAVVSRFLARQLLPSQTDQAFLGGLMHDIGKLLILQQHTASYERLILRGISDCLESIQAEVLEYPFDHTQVGHLIAERWAFSADLTNVISRHHRPWKDIPRHSVIALVKAANIITHAAALGASRELTQMRRAYEPLLPEAWEHLGVNEMNQRDMLERARVTFNDESELFDSWSRG
jgi:HD-like signal output (HDOD) protein